MKKLIPYFLIMILLSGCSFGDPEWYGIVIFKPIQYEEVKKTWTAELQYVDYSESQDGPPDIIRVSFHHEQLPPPEEIDFEIPNTDLAGTIELKENGEGEAVLDRTQLEDFIGKIILEDGTITGSIPLIIKWDSKTEEIELPYLTAIKDDARTKWEKFFNIFSS